MSEHTGPEGEGSENPPPDVPPPTEAPTQYPPPQYPPQQYAPPQYPSQYAPPQYPPPPPYAPPPAPYGYPPPAYAPQSRTSGFSIAALVLGILWLYWVGSILALIFGYIAKGQIDRSGGTVTGRGMAIAGIVLGWIGVGTLILFIVLIAAGTVSGPA
jgi:Domain of unknown function (DUF4190)